MSKVDELTAERGKNYGHPLKHFYCTQTMYDTYLNCRAQGQKLDNQNKDVAINHGVYMMLDKIARFAENPLHMDNLDDIQGYAETIRMVLNAGTDTDR